MTLESSVHAYRLRVIARAQALGNVSQACREFGVSRTLFYRWQRRYLAYGPDGLYPKRPGPRRGRPPTLSVEAERVSRDTQFCAVGGHLLSRTPWFRFS